MDVESTSERYATRTIRPVKGDTVLYSIDGNKQYRLGRVHDILGQNKQFTLVLGIDKTIHTVYSRDCIVITETYSHDEHMYTHSPSKIEH